MNDHGRPTHIPIGNSCTGPEDWPATVTCVDCESRVLKEDALFCLCCGDDMCEPCVHSHDANCATCRTEDVV